MAEQHEKSARKDARRAPRVAMRLRHACGPQSSLWEPAGACCLLSPWASPAAVFGRRSRPQRRRIGCACGKAHQQRYSGQAAGEAAPSEALRSVPLIKPAPPFHPPYFPPTSIRRVTCPTASPSFARTSASAPRPPSHPPHTQQSKQRWVPLPVRLPRVSELTVSMLTVGRSPRLLEQYNLRRVALAGTCK